MNHESSRPELLAPAGSKESFYAAIANGADAVYLGLEGFNARRNAQNLTLEELGELCRYAHVRDVKVYLAANIVILPSEIDDALELIVNGWNAGVDAVIIADLGLLDLVARSYPEIRIHASTQIGAHDTKTVEAIADLGASRVTLARELSIDEIREVASSGVEVEAFGHGALCVCYSGQCLMSSLIGQRSANRGMCAQPCRLEYELLDSTGDVIETPGSYLLSPKDLASIEVLPDLIGAGVSSIKIEGRMKSATYVGAVTAVYRNAIDRATSDSSDYHVSAGELETLAEVFSRGFSEAYLVGERGNDMMGYTRPNNRGVQVGRVHTIDAGRVTIAVEKDLRPSDIVEFWTSRGRFAQKVGPLTIDGTAVDVAPAGSRPHIEVEKRISPGDRIFRVENSALLERVGQTYKGSAAASAKTADGKTTALRITVRIHEGSPLQATFANADGTSVTVEGPLVEAARTKPITKEEVAEHIGRLGGTPYSIDSIDVELEGSVGMGFATLHAIRKEALARLEEAVLASWQAREQIRFSPVSAVRTVNATNAQTGTAPVELAVIVDDQESARRCKGAGADRLIVSADAILSGRVDIKALGGPTTVLLPRICHDGDFSRARKAASGAEATIASTLGLLDEVAALTDETIAGWNLNITNPYVANVLRRRGATSGILSPELNRGQIEAVCQATDLPLGLVVFGLQETMVTEHCVLMAAGPCNQDCASCRRRAGQHSLRDRKGYLFPVRTDIFGRSHVYNAVVLDLVPAMGEVVSSGVKQVIVDTTMFKPHQSLAYLERARTALSAAMLEEDVPKPKRPDDLEVTTSGHFYRGVL